MTSTREDTRSRILTAAEAVFADKGYHDAIVDEIVKATSLSKGGVYFHFPSKEDLFFAVLDRLGNRLVASAERAASKRPSPLEEAEAALAAVLAALSKRRRLARLLMVQGYSMGNSFERKRADMFNRFARVIEVRLQKAVAQGQIIAVDPVVAARIWLGAINEVVIHWLFSGGPAPTEALPLLRQILVGGLVAARSDGSARLAVHGWQ